MKLQYPFLLIIIFNCAAQPLLKAQPANEINCFRYFRYNEIDRSDKNAYLLSLLMHYNYPRAILGVADEASAEVKRLFFDNKLFLEGYKGKVAHYFTNPTIVNIDTTTADGYDPEAVLISTEQYIILVFRGTDRIAFNQNANPKLAPTIQMFNYIADNANYEFGEFVKTDFDARLGAAPVRGIRGLVHQGFSNSIMRLLPKLRDSLVKYNVQNKKLWITGHSLGCGLAQLCAAYLKQKYAISTHSLYLYAAPHVGNQAFVNQFESFFPGEKIQRFDFMNDPVSLQPLYALGYKRAGIRNLYTKEKGRNYNYNTTEATELENISAFFCMHNSEWYCRAAYFELIDGQENLQNSLPAPPPVPVAYCSDLDYRLINGERLENVLLEQGLALLRANFSVPVENLLGTALPNGEGVYRIRCAQGLKSLTVSGNCYTRNDCPFQLWSDANDENMRFEIRKIIGFGYILKVKNINKVLDLSDYSRENGTVLKTYDPHLIVNPLGDNQVWYLIHLGNNRFVIQNQHSRKVVDADSPATSNNGCRVMQWRFRENAENQIWILDKVGEL